MDCVPGVVAASRTSTVKDGCVRLLDTLYRAHTDSGETGHIRKNSSLYEPLHVELFRISGFLLRIQTAVSPLLERAHEPFPHIM